jgi:hypothetical protein
MKTCWESAPRRSSMCLNVDLDVKPVKQKRRKFAPERVEAITVEVEKLLKAQFIDEVYYLDWLANVVLVKKSNGKWRMCVNFTDLNKACPKDSFPLHTSMHWFTLTLCTSCSVSWMHFLDTTKSSYTHKIERRPHSSSIEAFTAIRLCLLV